MSSYLPAQENTGNHKLSWYSAATFETIRWKSKCTIPDDICKYYQN